MHRCKAMGCEAQVSDEKLMCWGHWRKVPLILRQQVWLHYRPGQEQEGGTFSREWHLAATQAIMAVAVKEKRITEEEARLRLEFVKRSYESEQGVTGVTAEEG
jgi:hypothetical protein